MESAELTLKQRLSLFQELLRCGNEIAYWLYAQDGHLIETNSQALVLGTFFERSGCLAYAMEHARDSTAPLILGAHFGLMWGAAIETREDSFHIHVIGPVLNTDLSLKTLQELSHSLDVDLTWRTEFIAHIQALPVVNQILLHQYALQLHYCVTGERLTRADLTYQKRDRTPAHDGGEPPRDRHLVYMAEQELLRCVREGDLDYRAAQANADAVSAGVRVHADRPMIQALVSATTYISLCVRAAIEGGLSPDTAYTVGDNYIQSILGCSTITELGSINYAMYDDFVHRVHRARTNPDLSRQVQACCDYIEMHLEEPISLEDLARQAGYTVYYFSRKFKQETGTGIGEYIRFARVERAQSLLTNTDLPVSAIAARLQFCSSSHFSNAFRSVTGMLPQKYREEHKLG